MKTPTATIPSWVRPQFEAFERGLNGAAARPLHTLRKEALERFGTLGLPTTKNEEWKYTNIARLARTDYQLAGDSSGTPLVEGDLEPFAVPGFSGRRLVFCDGRFVPSLSADIADVRGVSIAPLASVLGDTDSSVGKLVSEHLGEVARFDDDSFVALNTAFLRDGVVLHVEKGVRLESPLELFFLMGEHAAPTATHNRLLVVLEEGSSATILETCAGMGASEYFVSSVAEVVVRENASLTHVKIQRESGSAVHVASIAASLARDSRYTHFNYSFGGALVRNDIAPVLNGENIEANLYGVSILNAEQHVDNHTVIDHAQPNSVSNELYKGVYGDRSNGVFSGTIIVREDAQKTNAFQSNQSLLLADTATVETKPQLKIWADDVKCSHGATVGQLDENALFYLRARGIPLHEAKNMLIRAFANDVAEKLPDEALHQYLDRLVFEKLAETLPRS
ncbi:MAG: Fe-S cluster assembly protein SufD [Bdellovibrionales bacterium]|nr:Fe-S cluster assembly protein SufD [Bdellovibrionales bacterium]